MAQRQQILERIEFTMMAACEQRSRRQVIHQLADPLLRDRSTEQQRRVIQHRAVRDNECRRGVAITGVNPVTTSF